MWVDYTRLFILKVERKEKKRRKKLIKVRSKGGKVRKEEG